MKNYTSTIIIIFTFALIISCDNSITLNSIDCTEIITYDNLKGDCSETLNHQNEVYFNTDGDLRIITSNNIPDHVVGLFGAGSGSLNPNQIEPQNSRYEIDLNPEKNDNLISLSNNGPTYSFGILFNGIELDPIAAEPWPHTKPITSNHNWDWNLEATNAGLGLDCNNAHVQPNGKYHYHGIPENYLRNIASELTEMLLLGYAADGFPIYYQYGYINSELSLLNSSYVLKSGNRSGNGIDEPCGTYNGVYTADYEYIEGFGDLDECNGYEGFTPEYPNGTYYYVLTEAYPGIPRCFKGIPSQDFRIGN